MTKDELNKKLIGYGSLNKATVNSILAPFFESNVCIPKGENRHPYADVFHELVEDMTKELQFKLYLDDEWVKDKDIDIYDLTIAYRTKPSGPTYEYQWINTFKGAAVISKSFLTEDEAYENWEYRIEATKRERKQ